MAEKGTSINLLPQKGESLATQLINWTLTIGRLLIILTEMVALGTFLYRFTLDMEIVDLHDKIKSESFIVANFKSSEEHFRDIQDRLATIKRYDTVSSTTASLFTDITNLGKGKVTFRDLTVSPQNVKIEAQAASPTVASQFIEALKSHPAITAVTVDKVENSTANALVTISITASLKHYAFASEEQPTQTDTIQPILNSN